MSNFVNVEKLVKELEYEKSKNLRLQQRLDEISPDNAAAESQQSEEFSELQRIRQVAPPMLPSVHTANSFLEFKAHGSLQGVDSDVQEKFPITYGKSRVSLETVSDKPARSAPLRIGLVLSGGQAPGGHNVIAGVYDFIKKVSPDSVMVGFTDGPQGIYNGKYFIVDDAKMNQFRNLGGFDMLGSGRHKIEKPAEFEAAMANCVALKLDGLIVIGGDDSNTNAAVLAEYFEANNCATKVCGCPKTIDGDLKVSPFIPISFGFDTATRTFSEFIGNLGQDTLSTQKYYHFVRLMGRDASNIALECALQTRPNICLISEEIEEKKMTLSQIAQYIANVIVRRSGELGKDYGIILLPEGLIEFIPEFEALVSEINDVLATDVLAQSSAEPVDAVYEHLSPANKAVFSYLPGNIKQQILLERDPHGNVQVAKIETERLLAQTVEKELDILKQQGVYKGSFKPQFHSYGYEGRCGLPSTFDSTYCYALGYNAAALVSLGLNGFMSSVSELDSPVKDWQCGGVPITSMCRMEKRHGKLKPVIKKNLVELDQTPFLVFSSQRDDWAMYDLYRSPGPIQFFSPSRPGYVELCITLTLELRGSDPRVDAVSVEKLKQLQAANGKRYGEIFNVSITEEAAKTAYSEGQLSRISFKPLLCPSFTLAENEVVDVVKTQVTQCRRVSDSEHIRSALPSLYGAKLANIITTSSPVNPKGSPLRVGALFCGRQAAGGHDVLAAIVDALKARGDDSSLIGFIGGTVGLINNHAIEINESVISMYRNQGGCELLTRTEDLISSANYGRIINTCKENGIGHLVLLGGARTASQAALLSEYLFSAGVGINVVCVPVDASGSLKNEFVETSVGFDTLTKVAGQIVGNNATDGASAKKYYYFIRLMGQEFSNVILEVTLATKPNFAILVEEVEQKGMSLVMIVNLIADTIEARAKAGKNYGTILIPDGLIDVIPEFKFLITELDNLVVSGINVAEIKTHLTHWSRTLLERLPDFMQAALLLERGSDGKISVSQIETEKLLAHFVEIELAYRKKRGEYKGAFSAVCSFVGYQARGALPSNFDVNYAYNLGYAAVALLAAGNTGYLACISNLTASVSEWKAIGVPLCTLLEFKASAGAGGVAHIPRSTVDLSSQVYTLFAKIVQTCRISDKYENPGPMQFFGPVSLVNSVPHSVSLNHSSYFDDLTLLNEVISDIQDSCRPGCDSSILRMTLQQLLSINGLVHLVKNSK